MRNSALIFILVLIQSCSFRSKNKVEYEKVKEKYYSWEYTDLKENDTLRVLMFHDKKTIDLSTFTNFLIGINRDKDTIAVIDNIYARKLQPNDYVVIESCQWTSEEKGLFRPLVTVSKKQHYNDMYLSVDTVFYSCIKKSYLPTKE